jgi:hypothetical protein
MLRVTSQIINYFFKGEEKQILKSELFCNKKKIIFFMLYPKFQINYRLFY